MFLQNYNSSISITIDIIKCTCCTGAL